jgi:hypothetical protein
MYILPSGEFWSSLPKSTALGAPNLTLELLWQDFGSLGFGAALSRKTLLRHGSGPRLLFVRSYHGSDHVVRARQRTQTQTEMAS